MAIALASAAIVVACHNEVPRPTLPVSPPEITGRAPKPPPIDPSDPNGDKRDKKHQLKPKRVGEATRDAGMADSLSLPPIDGKVPLVRDAAQPLK
jgi:hypothetical protein